MPTQYTEHELKYEVEETTKRDHQTVAWLGDGLKIKGEGWLYDLVFDVANFVFGLPIIPVIKSVVNMFVSFFRRRS